MHGSDGNASRLLGSPLRPRRGPKGIQPRGGSKSGKAAAPSGHCPDTPSTSKAESPGRLRLAALESGFSSFRAEIASMFASLQGRFTASHPPGLATEEARHRDGGARGVETCADDPLASQQPCLGLLGPEALPLVGRAPGCDLSDPSHVMEPRGTTNHMAMAMDPVHGLQSGLARLGSIRLPSEEEPLSRVVMGLKVGGRCPWARALRPLRVTRASPRTPLGNLS